MNVRIGFLILMAYGIAIGAGAAGEAAIKGRVVITKIITKKRISFPLYDLRGIPVNPQATDTASFSDAPPDEFSRVVLYLEGPGLPPLLPTEGRLAQKNRRFDPDIAVVAVGSTISFPNEDPIFHNVFSLSKVKSFDLGYYPAGETRTVKFDRPGVVQVFCHIHPDMSAAIVVLPSKFWTRPGTDGSFSLSGVPPGSYDLVAWHRSAGFFRQPVTLGEGTVREVNFLIPVKDESSGALTEQGRPR